MAHSPWRNDNKIKSDASFYLGMQFSEKWSPDDTPGDVFVHKSIEAVVEVAARKPQAQ